MFNKSHNYFQKGISKKTASGTYRDFEGIVEVLVRDYVGIIFRELQNLEKI